MTEHYIKVAAPSIITTAEELTQWESLAEPGDVAIDTLNNKTYLMAQERITLLSPDDGVFGITLGDTQTVNQGVVAITAESIGARKSTDSIPLQDLDLGESSLLTPQDKLKLKKAWTTDELKFTYSNGILDITIEEE